MIYSKTHVLDRPHGSRVERDEHYVRNTDFLDD